MGTTPKNKAIDAEYLLKQFKALNTKVFEKTYSKIKNAIFTGSFSHNSSYPPYAASAEVISETSSVSISADG